MTAVAMHLSASTVIVTYIAANGEKDGLGYLVSPSTTSVNGASTTIYSDNFANTVRPGQSDTPHRNPLSTWGPYGDRPGSTHASPLEAQG